MNDPCNLAQIPPISPENWVDDHPLVAGLLHGPYHVGGNDEGGWWAEAMAFGVDTRTVMRLGLHPTQQRAIAACRIVADAIQKARHGVLP